MTTRVFDCERQLPAARPEPRGRSTRAGASRLDAIKSAFLTALFVVPLAGAAEAPRGWIVAGATALAVMLLTLLLGRRVRWAWLALLTAGAGLAMPRGELSLIGPALFVAAALCLVIWFTFRGRASRRDRDRPEPGSRRHAAQLMLGLSGERHVGTVLTRDLAQEYALINGLKLPRGAGDIDHLVVGPTGVFLLETKTMAGHIVCEPDGTWRRTRVGRAGAAYPAYIGDPAAQVQRNIFAVRQALQKRLPRLCRQTGLWIEGLVVFPHPRTELDAEFSRVPAVPLEEVVGRISMHAPARPLSPAEVDAIIAALLMEAQMERTLAARQSAQAIVELGLALPLVLALVFGTMAVSRLVQAQTAVIAVAQAAARAGALARSLADAIDQMRVRATVVAPGFGLDPNQVRLEWDVSRFAQNPGQVVAVVQYPLDFSDLPLVGWLSSRSVRAEHIEWVDPFRSGLSAQAEARN